MMQLMQTIRTRKLECISFILYIIALIFIMTYHEPWFDEAQAWLIARDASPWELVSSITHYEGHPPIWHFILMPAAKIGIPFEIGLKAINLILVSTAMGIFIFRSPFNHFIRCTVPFTYFFFYQYGVISRTYSLMMFGFVLSALTYKDRDEKPFRFVTSLALICGASAYGMIIAAGISVVWLWEQIGQPFSLEKWYTFIRSNIFKALFLLLSVNVLLLLTITPYPDTYAILFNKISIASKLFYMFLITPGEATFFMGALGDENQFLYSFLLSIFLHIFIISLVLKAHKTMLYVVPFLFLGLFGGIVYFSAQHIGILILFYMFIFWCSIAENENSSLLSNNKSIYYAEIVFLLLLLCKSIYWSAAASINDIHLNYGTGRETADFIKENHLDDMNILVSWYQDQSTQSETVNQMDYNFVAGVPELAYFSHNIFYNFNLKSDHMCYLTHQVDTFGHDTIELIKNTYPDVLIYSDTNDTFGNTIDIEDFVLVSVIEGHTIFKSLSEGYLQYIYIRKDLMTGYPTLSALDPSNFPDAYSNKMPPTK